MKNLLVKVHKRMVLLKARFTNSAIRTLLEDWHKMQSMLCQVLYHIDRIMNTVADHGTSVVH